LGRLKAPSPNGVDNSMNDRYGMRYIKIVVLHVKDYIELWGGVTHPKYL
jgi:hypothetical protein